MADPNDLINQIQGVQISSTCSSSAPDHGHLLTLEYPAFDLLPACTALFLERPAQIYHRQEPDPSLQPPDLVTEFFTVLSREPCPVLNPASILDSYDKLLQAIDSLKGMQGSSRLRFVTFRDNSDPSSVTYRFQLLATATYPYSATYIAYEVDLDEKAWDWFLLLAEVETWTEMVRELVTRASERAYLEVNSKVMLQDTSVIAAATCQDDLWREMWFTKPPRCAIDLFMACMAPVYLEDWNMWSDYGDGYLLVRFPCGHDQFARKIELMAHTSDSCLQEQCPSCSEPIMMEKARIELALRHEVKLRDEYSWRNQMWSVLDKQCFANDTNHYDFDSRMILEALDLALKSFAAPRLVTPACLVPTNLYHTETTTITQHWGGVYGRGSFEVKTTPADLQSHLHTLARETKTGRGPISTITVPPGFSIFLDVWLHRAMNFLIHRRCSEVDYEHEGVHEHEDGWCYFALSEEQKHIERHFGDMQRMMRDAALDEMEEQL